MAHILCRCRATTNATMLSFSSITLKPKHRQTSTPGRRNGLMVLRTAKAMRSQLGRARLEELGVKNHAYAAQTDYGY